MRVGLVVGSGNPAFGGVERHVIQVANGLVASGNQAFIVMGHPAAIDQRHGLNPEVEEVRVAVPDGRSFPRFAAAGLRAIRERRPCLLHSHLTYGLALGVLARSRHGIPLVYTEHFLVRKSGDRGMRGTVGALLRGRADALIFVSDVVGRECRVAGGRPDRHLIYNGTTPPPATPRRQASPRLLYVGRLEPDKRVHVVLDVARALRNEGYTLDVVGTGSCDESLRSAASDLVAAGIVRFHGWQDRPETFLEAGGVLLLPAREGLGYAVLEAIAHGVPAVAPSDSGAAEVVAATGEGVVVPAEAPVEAWVDATRRASRLPETPVPFPDPFRLSHMVRATLAVYGDLWDRGGRLGVRHAPANLPMAAR